MKKETKAHSHLLFAVWTKISTNIWSKRKEKREFWKEIANDGKLLLKL